MAAFRMALDPTMQQVVEVGLNITPATITTPDQVLDRIADYIRAKRNVALDRMAFEERKQGPSESFDDFFIALRRLADAADLCGNCSEKRLVTRIIAGTRDTDRKKKLLAISPFPSLQDTVNICRSEESVRANERILSGHSGVVAILTKHGQSDRRASKSECGACGRASHAQGENCPAIGKSCHICGKPDHFAPKCSNRNKEKGGTSGGASGGAKSKMAHISIGNIQANQKRRGSPTISLEVLQDDGGVAALLTNVVPDPSAEVSVCGKVVMEAIGLSESHLATSSFDLVMADRSSTLLSIGQRDITVRYGGKSARITVVFCPEISGMLVCRVDCVNLNILHRDSPKSLAPINLLMAADVPLPSDDPVAPPSGPFLRGVYISLEPSAEQISVVEAAIAAEFEIVFYQDDGLR
jgi:hypothetical protein